MALHRKQRGPADALPQYVRLPAARAVPSPVASATTRHPRKPRARLLRDVYPAPRQQISSLQLRACFLLCVLLYFGTIYFADNIVSLGQALGSEPTRSSHDFFVQSDAAVKDGVTAHMRVAVRDDDTGGGEEDKTVKEEGGATDRENAAQDKQDDHPHDEKKPREGQDDAPLPAPNQEQGAIEDTTKAREPEAVAPVEGLIPAKAAERDPKPDERLVVHFPALMRPQRVVGDGADAATDGKVVHPAPERRSVPGPKPDAHEAVAAANAPAHLAEPAATDEHTAPREHDADDAAAEAEPKHGDAVKALLRGAPPDEVAREEKPRTEEQEEPADPAPHEEHR